jgi:hypothetical protein
VGNAELGEKLREEELVDKGLGGNLIAGCDPELPGKYPAQPCNAKDMEVGCRKEHRSLIEVAGDLR